MYVCKKAVGEQLSTVILLCFKAFCLLPEIEVILTANMFPFLEIRNEYFSHFLFASIKISMTYIMYYWGFCFSWICPEEQVDASSGWCVLTVVISNRSVLLASLQEHAALASVRV